MEAVGRRHGAQHGKRLSAFRTWIATSALFVGGFAAGLGAHQSLTSSGARRAVFAFIALGGVAVLLALAVQIRRERPGEHVR